MAELDIISIGANSLIGGLNYHFNNFCMLNDRLIINDGKVDVFKSDEIAKKMKHELVAYFNRMGQVYYLAKAEQVKQTKMIPTIKKHVVFRQKYTAHRSSDYPENDNLMDQKHLNATFSYGHTFMNNNLVVQYISIDKPNVSRHFDILEEHDAISEEAQNLINWIKTNST